MLKTTKGPAVFSSEERDELAQLAADWRLLLARSQSVAARLSRARKQREQVESRLRCVLHDFLVPAVQDLEAITAAAGEHGGPASQAASKVRPS